MSTETVLEGVLEKKKQHGSGWKKQRVVLTPSQWIVFNTSQDFCAQSSVAAAEITNVMTEQEDRVFSVVTAHKRSKYRTMDNNERNAWLQALAEVTNIAPVCATTSMSGLSRSQTENSRSTKTSKTGSSQTELVKLCDQFRPWLVRNNAKDSESFTGQQLLHFLEQTFPEASKDEHSATIQELRTRQFIKALNNDRGDDELSYQFTKSFTWSGKKFSVFHKGNKEEIDKVSTCNQDDDPTVTVAAYPTYIRTMEEITSMHDRISDLRQRVQSCSNPTEALLSATSKPNKDIVNNATEEVNNALIYSPNLALRDAEIVLYDLEASLEERDLDQVVEKLLEWEKRKHDASDVSDHIQDFHNRFVQALRDQTQALTKIASTHIEEVKTYIRCLNRLGERSMASSLFLDVFSVQLKLRLQQVATCLDSSDFVASISKIFFASLLEFHHTFQLIVDDQAEAFSHWAQRQVETYVHRMHPHVQNMSNTPQLTKYILHMADQVDAAVPNLAATSHLSSFHMK